ncbi:MAG: glucokinase [Solirubrobacteraceae bacterium]|jgi:glucokinase|nr:glucokinase [Solirubrobacteraceae bacterium]
MTEVIGVDLGGTKVAVARLAGGELGESMLEATAGSDSAAVVDQLAAMIEKARGDHLEGVGIGVPSVVEFETGRVVSSANIPLADVPLRDVLGERIGVPVFVDNDATVAALAEAHDEDLKMVARDLVMITVGTGVGGGLVLGGRIYRGATGGAGEFGHTLIGTRLDGHIPSPGDFPQKGSLEYAAAGHALDRLATESAHDHPDSALARLLDKDGKVTGEQAVQAARDGDEVAAATVEMWGERLGIGIANAINTFDPEEVVIGGGAARAGDLLLGPAERIAAGYVLPGLGSKTRIRLARHGVRAGVLGAALLALHEVADAAVTASTHDLHAPSKAGS